MNKYTIINSLNGHNAKIKVDWDNGGAALLQNKKYLSFANSESHDNFAKNVNEEHLFENTGEKDKFKIIIIDPSQKDDVEKLFQDENLDPSLKEHISFVNENEFLEYEVKRINKEVNQKRENLKDNEAIAFTDGSFREKISDKTAAAAFILTSTSEKEESKLVKTDDRQITGEVEAVKLALNWAENNKITKIDIYSDLQNLIDWVLGYKENGSKLKDFVSEKEKKMKIVFHQVPAHQGVIYNEKVDKLAKQTISADEKN